MSSNHVANYYAGRKIRKIYSLINEENRKVSKDTENRRYVTKKVIDFIKEGLSEDEAIEKIMKDDVMQEFEYLIKNNIDIKNLIKQWVKKSMEYLNVNLNAKDEEER